MKTKTLLDPLTFNELASMDFDNADADDFWFVRDGADIHFHQQEVGSASVQRFVIPARVLKRLVSKLIKQQAVGSRSRRK